MIQLRVLQNLCMQICHSIHTKAIMNINMRHMNHIITVNDRNSFIIETSSYLIIQYLNDRNQLWHNLHQIMSRPLFQCFRQYCMICISTGSAYNIDGRIHIHSLCNEKTDQLRNDHGRMCIINLDHCIFIQIIQITSFLLTLVKNQLRRITYHKILLVDS